MLIRNPSCYKREGTLKVPDTVGINIIYCKNFALPVNKNAVLVVIFTAHHLQNNKQAQ